MSDPRDLIHRAFDQYDRLVAGIAPHQLDLPTPCTDFDLRTLLGHLVAGMRRITVAGQGGDALAVPLVVTGTPDDGWPGAFAQARAAFDAVWFDDTVLDRPCTLPFGTLPGHAAVGAYAQEAAVHGWDVARTLGREDELDIGLAEATAPIGREKLPAEPRGGRIPFGPVVPVPDDADAYTRLVAWTGRRP